MLVSEDAKMDAMINTKAWWNAKGQKYTAKNDDRDRPDEARIAAGYIVGNIVLEVGVAFGHFSKYIPDNVGYIGIEISDYLIGEARKNYPSRLFIHADVMELNGQWYEAVDTVCAFQLLEHFHNPFLVAKHLKNIAKHRLIITVPRGMPNEAALRDDGHIFGWEDEEHLIKYFEDIGAVTCWNGAENHLCAYVDF